MMNKWNKGQYMRTYTNKKFYPSHPEEMDICIEDIAHALSQMNRYCGHLKYFYSVAQHSLIVEELFCRNVELALELDTDTYRHYQLQALLHDATEAYMPDMPSPIKKLLPDFKKMENALHKVIFKHYGLPLELHPYTHDIDQLIRGSEIRCLTDWKEEWAEDIYKYNIIPMSSKLAEDKFLERYNELTST